MPLIAIPVSEANVEEAGDQLAREVERLEVTGKRIVLVRYPPRYAES